MKVISKGGWYVDKTLVREVFPDGNVKWFKNGKLHREGGPAIESEGTKGWWINGERHREDGPAIEWASGDKEWYINDEKVSETEHKAYFYRVRKLRYKYYYKWVEWHFNPNRKGSKVYQNLYKKLEEEVGEFLSW